MRSRILASVAVAALLSAPAFAQSSSSSAPTAPSTTESRSDSTAPAAGSSAGSSATTSGTSGSTSGSAITSGSKSADATKPAVPAAAIIPTQEQGQLTADNLIGMDVRNPQDEKVGKIEDLVLDADMKVVGVVVSVGGFLGMGKHDVALSRDQVQIAAAGDKNARVATVSMTKDQLKAAPEFKTLDQQQAEAEQNRARQSQGTAAGSGARPMGSGTTTPPAKNQ